MCVRDVIHKHVYAHMHMRTQALEIQPTDRLVVSVTLFHSFGIGMGVAAAFARVHDTPPCVRVCALRVCACVCGH